MASPAVAVAFLASERYYTMRRVEAYTAEGRPLVFSNPIYFRTDDRVTVSTYKRVLCR